MPPVKSTQGVGYSQMEIDSLLDLLEEHLPIASMEWERIENLHKCNFPTEDRRREFLKQKFQDLYRSKIPTGDPSMPNDIRRAKRIHQLMEERINSSDCEGIDEFHLVAEEKQKGH